MKTNVTLKLDADPLREARVLAAEEGRSISALLTERLEAMVRERRAFDKTRRRALARLRDGARPARIFFGGAVNHAILAAKRGRRLRREGWRQR